MDSRRKFVGLDNNWSPPPGLDRLRPREVRLSAAGKALIGLAVLLAAGGLALGLYLTGTALRQQREAEMLKAAPEATARITRLWRSGDGNRRYRTSYEFSVDSRTYHRSNVVVPARVWRGLRVGSDLPIRYVPSDPAVNRPRDWEPRLMPLWAPPIIAVALMAAGIVPLVKIRTQRYLLAEGRPAPGVITRHKKTQHGVVWYFEFRTLDGATRTGQSGPTKRPPKVGETMVVLYDGELPEKCAPYPLSLVRLERS